jgi:hypothetical protein
MRMSTDDTPVGDRRCVLYPDSSADVRLNSN